MCQIEFGPLMAIGATVIFILIFVWWVKIFINEKKAQRQMMDEEPLDDTCGDTQDDTPALEEISCKIVELRCGTDVFGTKLPRVTKQFGVKVLTDDGQELEFLVDEDIYAALEEGVHGTVAIVNERFYGFWADEA